MLLGMLSGVGGGIARDLLVAEIPNVLRREFYAVAALLGAMCVVAGHALGLPATPTAVVGARPASYCGTSRSPQLATASSQFASRSLIDRPGPPTSLDDFPRRRTRTAPLYAMQFILLHRHLMSRESSAYKVGDDHTADPLFVTRHDSGASADEPCCRNCTCRSSRGLPVAMLVDARTWAGVQRERTLPAATFRCAAANGAGPGQCRHVGRA